MDFCIGHFTNRLHFVSSPIFKRLIFSEGFISLSRNNFVLNLLRQNSRIHPPPRFCVICSLHPTISSYQSPAARRSRGRFLFWGRLNILLLGLFQSGWYIFTIFLLKKWFIHRFQVCTRAPFSQIKKSTILWHSLFPNSPTLSTRSNLMWTRVPWKSTMENTMQLM